MGGGFFFSLGEQAKREEIYFFWVATEKFCWRELEERFGWRELDERFCWRELERGCFFGLGSKLLERKNDFFGFLIGYKEGRGFC